MQFLAHYTDILSLKVVCFEFELGRNMPEQWK